MTEESKLVPELSVDPSSARSPDRALRSLPFGLSLALALGAGCKVPGPPPAFVYPAPPPAAAAPAAEKGATRWFGEATPEPDAAGAPLAERSPQNEDSALGLNVLPPQNDQVLFANRFRHATPWTAVARRGFEKRALEVDANGEVVRLQRGQVARSTVLLEVGRKYVLSWKGSGRVELGGARQVERLGLEKRSFVAAKKAVRVRIERMSPSVPVRNVSIVPADLAETTPVPRFDPAYLDVIEGYSVLRFPGWGGGAGAWTERASPERVFQAGAGGVAYEHLFDLARQIQADAWLLVPSGADEAYARGLAEMARARLHPASKLFVENADGTGATSLQPFLDVLGQDRVVRVLAVPLDAETARGRLEQSGVRGGIDALAVEPALELDGASPSQLNDEALAALRVELKALAALARELDLRMLASWGGLKTKRDALARDPNAGLLVSKVLEAWKSAGGEVFVVGPLFGAGRPIESLASAPGSSPQVEALARFRKGEPRWWKELRPAAPSSAGVEAEELPAPEAAVAAAPPPLPEERLYTAPWAKWVSFGASLAFGGFAAERLISARNSESDRDDGLAALPLVTEAQRFDDLQDEIRGADSDRELAEILGFTAIGVSAAFLGWGILQWLDEPPSPEVVLPSWAEGAESREAFP
ncbi:MAG: hypothetical protein AAFZ18_01325 [Myxococcota bacterium]